MNPGAGLHEIPTPSAYSLGAHRSVPYVHYEPSGEPNGEIIALHHGIGMPATHWDQYPHELADLGYDVYAIGLAEDERSVYQRASDAWFVMAGAAVQATMQPHRTPELWLSAVNEVWREHRLPLTATLGRYATDAAEAMDGIIGEPSHIVGVSWGGSLVQQLGMDHPESVKSVIAAASIPAVPMPWLELPDTKAVATVMMPWRPKGAVSDLYRGDFKDPELLKEYAHLLGRQIELLPHLEQQQAIMLSFMLAWRNMASVAIQETRVPTTFLYSDDDPLIPRRMVELGAQLLGADAHLIESGGHGFLLSRPKEMAALTDRAISRNPVATAA